MAESHAFRIHAPLDGQVLVHMDLIERSAHGNDSRHPWETARAEFFSMVDEKWVVAGEQVSWLDIGAGDAWLALRLLRDLPEGSTMTCWDENFEEADLCELREQNPDASFVVQRPGDLFDVISLLDVLEHVENDEAFLASVVENCLRPGGLALVSVPAYSSLFTRHDTALQHFRRYDPSQIRALIEHSGLIILHDGGLFTSLLPVRLVEVAVERLARQTSSSTGVGAWGGGPTLTGLVRRALVADSRFSLWLSERNLRFPGLSYWAVCTK